MHKKQLTSTKIGKDLLTKAGDAFKSKFDSMAATCTLAPGDVLQVDAPSSLGCSKLFFIECLPWDGVRGQSVQVKHFKVCGVLFIRNKITEVVVRTMTKSENIIRRNDNYKESSNFCSLSIPGQMLH